MRYLLYSLAGAGQNFIELSKLMGRSQEMNFYLNRRAYHTPLEKYKEWMPFLRAIFAAPAAAAAASWGQLTILFFCRSFTDRN